MAALPVVQGPCRRWMRPLHRWVHGGGAWLRERGNADCWDVAGEEWRAWGALLWWARRRFGYGWRDVGAVRATYRAAAMCAARGTSARARAAKVVAGRKRAKAAALAGQQKRFKEVMGDPGQNGVPFLTAGLEDVNVRFGARQSKRRGRCRRRRKKAATRSAGAGEGGADTLPPKRRKRRRRRAVVREEADEVAGCVCSNVGLH